MVFREVDVVEVKEMLRLWVRGHGYKSIARLTQIDRKTVRRYVEAALRAGLRQAGGFVNYIWPHRDDQIWPHPWARGTGYSASMNALSGGPDSRAVSGLWAMGGSFTSGCWRRGSVGPAGGGDLYEVG